jgi:hypothetical protein
LSTQQEIKRRVPKERLESFKVSNLLKNACYFEVLTIHIIQGLKRLKQIMVLGDHCEVGLLRPILNHRYESEKVVSSGTRELPVQVGGKVTVSLKLKLREVIYIRNLP